MIYNSGAIRWQIDHFLSDGNSNVSTIFHRLLDIRKELKFQKFDIGNEGQCQGGENGACIIRLAMFDYANGYTHIHTHNYTR